MNRRIKIRRWWNLARWCLSFLLLAFYLTVGCIFLFTDTWADLLPKSREMVGIIIILFGILRFYVAYRRFKNKKLIIANLQIKKDDEQAA